MTGKGLIKFMNKQTTLEKIIEEAIWHDPDCTTMTETEDQLIKTKQDLIEYFASIAPVEYTDIDNTNKLRREWIKGYNQAIREYVERIKKHEA